MYQIIVSQILFIVLYKFSLNRMLTCVFLHKNLDVKLQLDLQDHPSIGMIQSCLQLDG